MSLSPGLCSVALRHLDPDQVVECALAGGAAGIEWEARRHVAPGDLDAATKAARLCLAAGLDIPSYGTYARAGADGARDEFAACLASAAALATPLLRVWTERSTDIEPTARALLFDRVVADLTAFCDLAAIAGRHVSLEFHPGTFTETPEQTHDLLRRVGRHNLRTHWQPDYGQPLHEAEASLQQMLPALSYLHVFCWTKEHVRMPLRDNLDYWSSLLELARTAPALAWPRYAMIEFSPDDQPDAVVADLRALGQLLPR
ncbi:TIM barrel protein [Devosia sp. LjRoot16]|jgi:hypothetical protein|uniref:sugar phosphate isomerase/epimerase family protein n=1 Tax=Devosia sp. LjRoot16 TaxID=3342271 RepID=UPI003ECE63EB